MLSELHNLSLKLCSKQYNKKIVLHLIVVPQLSSGWRHYYSTKTRQAGWANEQSMYSLMSIYLAFFLLVSVPRLAYEFFELYLKGKREWK
jgi:hypothetical protein